MLSLWTYSYSKFVIKIPKQNHEDILSVSLLLTQSKFLSNRQIMTATSEPAKHLASNKEHFFLWNILLDAPKDGRTRKNLEAFFIAKLKPSLNRQEDSNMLTLFRNGVT